jgi:hypothetical protein
MSTDAPVSKILTSFDIGIVNMAYCMLDTLTSDILYWEVFSLCNTNEIENTMDLVRKMDERPWILESDVILLEKQPSINPKMRIMAESLRSYLILRGLIDNNKKFELINYSPRYKLKCYDGPVPEYKLASEYAIRKKTSIFHCNELLKNQPKHAMEIFTESQSKKDDLSDCFLQGLSYIMFENSKESSEPQTAIQRAPTKKQIKFKRFSRNNIKYLCYRVLESNKSDKGTLDYQTFINSFVNRPEILKSIKQEYTFDWKNNEMLWNDLEFSDHRSLKFKPIRSIFPTVRNKNSVVEPELDDDIFVKID